MVRWTDRPAMTIAVDLECKAIKQTNKDWAWITDGIPERIFLKTLILMTKNMQYYPVKLNLTGKMNFFIKK